MMIVMMISTDSGVNKMLQLPYELGRPYVVRWRRVVLRAMGWGPVVLKRRPSGRVVVWRVMV